MPTNITDPVYTVCMAVQSPTVVPYNAGNNNKYGLCVTRNVTAMFLSHAKGVREIAMGVTDSVFEAINVIRRGMAFPALERTYCMASDDTTARTVLLHGSVKTLVDP
jgi:hypothetical protein